MRFLVRDNLGGYDVHCDVLTAFQRPVNVQTGNKEKEFAHAFSGYAECVDNKESKYLLISSKMLFNSYKNQPFSDSSTKSPEGIGIDLKLI